jgi:hypothetical protein
VVEALVRRSTAVLVLSLAAVLTGSALPALAADPAPPPTASLSARAGDAARADLRSLTRSIVVARSLPRTVPGIKPLPVRPPGASVLTDIRARPVAASTFRRTTAVLEAAAIQRSTSRALAATRVQWGHPDDTRAVLWSKQTAIAIERQVDLALSVLLPRDTPLWLRLELRRASLTAVKSTFCSGLEAVVLRPDGQVSVDLGQVLQEVLRTSATRDLSRAMAYRSNLRAWSQSMADTVSNVSKSTWLTDDRDRGWHFDPRAYSGVTSFGYHALAVRTVLPRVFDGSGRHLTRAAFVLARTCYAPPRF